MRQRAQTQSAGQAAHAKGNKRQKCCDPGRPDDRTQNDEDAVARTSQIRLSIEGAQVAGLLDLSLNLGVANATATLHEDGEHCSSNPDYRAAVFRPATASLIDLDLSVLGLPPLNLLPPVAAVTMPAPKPPITAPAETPSAIVRS